MTTEIFVAVILGALPGVLAAGGLWVRVSRLEKDIEKLDQNKASKEFADGLKGQISDLKSELDKRFDHLEELLRNGR
jgi:hypothetical protein